MAGQKSRSGCDIQTPVLLPRVREDYGLTLEFCILASHDIRADLAYNESIQKLSRFQPPLTGGKQASSHPSFSGKCSDA